ASATLVANKGDLAKAQLNLSFCKVLSPIAGKISRTKLTEGNLITADQTLLTTVVTVDPIYAYFDVDERTVLRIEARLREEISDAGVDLAGKYPLDHNVDEATKNKALPLIRDRISAANRQRLTEMLQAKLGADGLRGLFDLLEKNPRYPSYRDTDVPV